MKKAEIVKLLKQMGETEMSMYNLYNEQGKDDMAKAHIHASMAYDSAIWLLTDKQYAANMAAIYQDVEG